MPTLTLTKANIDNKAKPSPLGDVIYWDTKTCGLGLKVTPTGAKTFVLQSRLRGTEKDARIKTGSYGAWHLDSYDERDARRKAQELKQKFENGIDLRAKASRSLGSNGRHGSMSGLRPPPHI